MLFGFRTITFTKFPIESALQTISRLGYDGVELCLENNELKPASLRSSEIRRIRDLLENIGLEISALSLHSDFVANEQDFEEVFKAIRFTKEFGHDIFIICPGYLRTMDKRVLLEKLVQKLGQLLLEAEKQGIILALEPEPAMIVEDSSEAQELIKKLASKSLKINLDIGHSHCVGEPIEYSVEALKDHIVHVHLEDMKDRIHKHLIPGEGDLDIAEILRTFRNIRYKGFITVDLFDVPFPEKAAENSITYLRKVDGLR